MPPPLSEIQAWLRTAITQPGSLVAGPAGDVIHGQLHVYEDAWFLRLEEGMRDDYPAVAKCLSQQWETLLRDYLRVHPSRSYTLAHTGDALPEYLERLATVSNPTQEMHSAATDSADSLISSRIAPGLADLARLERAYYQCFSCADRKPWDSHWLSALSGEALEQLRLTVQPGVQLLTSSWDIVTAWKDETIPTSGGNTAVLIFRGEDGPKVQRIDAGEAPLLVATVTGITLGELLDLFPDESTLAWLTRRGTEGVIRPITD